MKTYEKLKMLMEHEVRLAWKCRKMAMNCKLHQFAHSVYPLSNLNVGMVGCGLIPSGNQSPMTVSLAIFC